MENISHLKTKSLIGRKNNKSVGWKRNSTTQRNRVMKNKANQDGTTGKNEWGAMFEDMVAQILFTIHVNPGLQELEC